MTDKYRNTPKGRIAPNGYRLCDPLSEGEILSDIQKQQWVIGKPIGCGGFGEIYLCHDRSDPSKKNYVMKLDNKCGPLFVEVNFVIRACSAANVKAFMDSHKLTFLGIPTFIASGTHQVGKNGGYRFLVMDRLGEELQNVLEKTRLSIPVTCRIASRIIDALEFIHEQGYIHADIKAQNILRATVDKNQTKKRSSKRAYEDIDDNVEDDDKYYLIDYGLVERYTLKGVHKPYEFDKRTANNGTCEFRSRDAHIGVISRRSDIESLGFNIILWFYGHHPWANMVKNADQVHEKKCWAMNNIDTFLKEAFGDKSATGTETDAKAPPSKSKAVSKKNIPPVVSPPKGLNKFFEEIKDLSHDAKPDYCKLKNILSEIAKLNSVESTRTTSNGNKKKPSTNGVVSSAKKTITKNKRKSETLDDDSVDAPSVKSKRALTTKVPLKSKSNLFVVNGASNGASIDESFNDETEEDEDIYEPFKKSSTKSKPKLKNLSAKKTNGTRNKRHSLASSLKKIKPIDKLNCKTPNRPLRNRIKLEDDIDLSDDDVKEIKPSDVKYTNGTEKKPRRIPRLSTPLIAMTPPDGGDSPLFGPFEPDDSIKENRIVPNPANRSNNISSFLQNDDDDEDTQDRHLRTCRIYINNKRCRPPQTSDISTPIQNNSSSHPHLSSSNSSATIEEEDIKPVLTNGKLNKRPYSITKKAKPTVVRKVNNGKAKTNGHIISSTASSSKSTSTARKNRLAKPTEDSTTSAPVSSSVMPETAAMQRIRLLIEKKRQSITSIIKK